MAKQLELLILYRPKRLFKNASFFWFLFFFNVIGCIIMRGTGT